MAQGFILRRGSGGSKVNGGVEQEILVDSAVSIGDVVSSQVPSYSLNNPDYPPVAQFQHPFDLDINHTGTYMVTGGSALFGVIYKKVDNIWKKKYDLSSFSEQSQFTRGSVNPQGTLIALITGYDVDGNAPSIYKINEDESVTKLTSLTALPNAPIYVKFSPDGTYLLVSTSPGSSGGGIYIYKVVGETFVLLNISALSGINYFYSACFSDDMTFLAVGRTASNYLIILKRTGDSWALLSPQPTQPNGAVNDVSFSPNGQYLAVARTNVTGDLNYVWMYKISGDTFTKITFPVFGTEVLASTVSFNKDNDMLVVGINDATTALVGYQRVGDTFTVIPSANFDRMITARPYVRFSRATNELYCGGNVTGLGAKFYAYKQTGLYFNRLDPLFENRKVGGSAFSPDNKLLVVGADSGYGSDVLTACDVSGDYPVELKGVFDTQPTGTVNSVAFSPDGKYLAVAHLTTPFVTIYTVNTDKTFTKIANPGTLPASTGTAVCFNNASTYLAVAHSNSPYVTVYQIVSGVFSKIANPSVLPTGNPTSIAYSPDDSYLVVGHATSPFHSVYKQTGITLAKVDNPAVLPSNNVFSCLFVDATTYVLGTNTSGSTNYDTLLVYKIVNNKSVQNKKFVNLYVLKIIRALAKYKHGFLVSNDLRYFDYDSNSNNFIASTIGSVTNEINTINNGTIWTISFSNDGKFMFIGGNDVNKTALFKKVYSKNGLLGFDKAIIKQAKPKLTPVKAVVLP